MHGVDGFVVSHVPLQRVIWMVLKILNIAGHALCRLFPCQFGVFDLLTVEHDSPLEEPQGFPEPPFSAFRRLDPQLPGLCVVSFGIATGDIFR